MRTRRQSLTPDHIAAIWRAKDANQRTSYIAERLRIAKAVIERVLSEPRPEYAALPHDAGPIR